MNDPSPQQLSVTRPWAALVLTLIAQMMASMALTAPSVFAPVVAPALGFAPQSIGWFVGAVYLSAMFSGLIAGHYVRQFGAVRLSQVAMLLTALGLVFAAAGVPLLLLLATLAIGVGYGLTNPTAAHILSHHAPDARRGLFFSIKQTGVPFGVALAGMIIPAFLKLWSWQVAAIAVAALVASTSVVLARYRRVFDVTREAVSLDWRTLVTRPLARVLREPALRRLSISSFCYAGTQICFLTFLVSDLKLERGFSLAAAAGALATAQITSVAARPFWGYVADRYIDPRTLLALLGVAMAASLALLALLPTNAGVGAVIAVAMLVAATVSGWNGVFYADLARHVRQHEIAMITGGTQFMTFCGGMIGPAAFASAISVLASYAKSFLLLALFPLAIGVWLLGQTRDMRASGG
jgi:MFS family permease